LFWNILFSRETTTDTLEPLHGADFRTMTPARKDVSNVSGHDAGVLRRANTWLRVNGTRSVRSRVGY
jgi:hypothetical protein